MREELKAKTSEYFADAQVVDHIFASVKDCQDLKPLIAGAILKSKLNHSHDIHLVRFGYRSSYLKQFVNCSVGPKPHCQVCDVPFINTEQCFDHIFKAHKDLLESFYPIFLG